jgi:O-antigen/teichoic acid export membrane protein
MNQLRQKVARGATWTAALHGASMVIELAITALLARLLSPAQFGIVAAAMLFMGLVNVFSEVGVAPTIIQMPDLTRDDLRTGLTVSLYLSLCCALATWLGSTLVATIFHMPELGDVLKELGGVFLLRGISLVSEAKLTRDLHVKEVRLVQLGARTFGYGLFSAVFAWNGYGYWALVYGSLIEEALRATGIYAIARIPFSLLLSGKALRRIFSSSAGFTGINIVNFIALNGDTAIVARATDAVSTGLYSRAFKLMSFPTTLYSKIADQVVFPAMASLQGQPERLRKAYLEATALAALIGLPISVVIALVGPDLILFFYGPKWVAATPIFAALSLGIFARFSTRTSSSLLRATGNLKGLFISQIIYAIGTVVGCTIAIPFGLIAMSATVSLVLVLCFFINTGFAFRSVNVDIPTFFSAHLAGLKTAAIVAFVTWAVLDLCHRNALHGFVPLAASGVAIALVGVMLAVTRSQWMLGEVGMKIANALHSKVRRFSVKREA